MKQSIKINELLAMLVESRKEVTDKLTQLNQQKAIQTIKSEQSDLDFMSQVRFIQGQLNVLNTQIAMCEKAIGEK